ncbi:hypothetical protein ACJQWK_04772 [Exserohilum turcicum]
MGVGRREPSEIQMIFFLTSHGQEMLARAKRNLENSDAKNISFIKSPITAIPIESGTADVVISNCVINLVPHGQKALVFYEMARILKPGGRVAVSDILAKKPLPEDLQKDMATYVGCISGASLVGEYEEWLKSAGFREVSIVDAGTDVNVYRDAEGSECCTSDVTNAKCSKEEEQVGCCGGQKAKDEIPQKELLAKDVNFNEWVGSFKILAVR